MCSCFQKICKTPIANTFDHLTCKTNNGKYIPIALGIIVLLGSLAAAGYFYSQLGYVSLAIGAAGAVLCIVSLIVSSCCCTFKNPNKIKPSPTPTPQPSPVDPTPIVKPIKKPAYPNIADLNLNNASPLLNEMDREPFKRKVGAYSFFMEDGDLLQIPLSFWLDQNTGAPRASDYLQIINDPSRHIQVGLINQRLADLDQAVQFKKRFQLFGYSNYKVQDLFSAWPHSIFKIALMLDDELSALTASSIGQLNFSQTDLLCRRIRALKLSENNGKWLFDLVNLQAQQINQNPAKFPPLALLLIAVVELQKIEINRLTSEQLKLIFSARQDDLRPYAQLLLPSQINACIPWIKKESFNLFYKLSDIQVLQFDLTQMDQLIFDGIFDAPINKIQDLLQAFALDKIYQLSQFFRKSLNYWEFLSDQQILNYDYSKIDQYAFDHMFTSDKADTLFAAISDPQLLAAKHLIANLPEDRKTKLTTHQKQLLTKS